MFCGITCINEQNGTVFSAETFLRTEVLKEHLTSVCPENVPKDAVLFRAIKAQFKKAGTLPKHRFDISRKPFLEASYKVDYRIAKQNKSHTIGKPLVKPCALEMVELVCGLEQNKILEAVPFSIDLIRSAIPDISLNVLRMSPRNWQPRHSLSEWNWLKL
jgi:hypothetical protein